MPLQPSTSSTGAPTVTVILATYNYSTVLTVAVQSALYQTFTDFELLIVGDCCTDDTAEVVASFDDPRIQWFNLPENSGSQAMPNLFGLDRARGEFIAYLNQDDVWAPDHLETLVTAMRDHNADIAHTLSVEYKYYRDDVVVICGMPNSNLTGPDRLDMFAASTMHRADVERITGSWKDWRLIGTGTPAAAWPPIVNYRNRLVTVRRITVAKANSSERINSYIDKPWEKQAAYLDRMRRDPSGWMIPDLITALEAVYLKKPLYEVPLPKYLYSKPGAVIEYLRRLRGLPALLDLPTPDTSTTFVQRIKRTVRYFIRRSVPRGIRKGFARVLVRASQYIED